MTIRPVIASDLPALKKLIDKTELFPGEMLNSMIASHLADPTKSSEVWLTETTTTQDDDDIPVSVVFAGPEKLTVGTYNAFLLAVDPDHQRLGLGRGLMRHLEDHLRATRSCRLLLVETSGNEELRLPGPSTPRLAMNKKPSFGSSGKQMKTRLFIESCCCEFVCGIHLLFSFFLHKNYI